jgi:hypothetical protein
MKWWSGLFAGLAAVGMLAPGDVHAQAQKWSGIYIGGHVGGAWSDLNWTNTGCTGAGCAAVAFPDLVPGN